ncbi:TRAP transporter small permease [Bacillus suaedaesalsae]|uniref:TRAP transporter small permease n=1 Tax=Bacillus suaedaesalsae TaxID=2810349 RepID=A0ABS2DI04_9BACI|nr:TRAP transporter small permease [Bacillus suaedaesalsae]MBM6618127.1 TRAP transporter small permease [Bacillus suaedaesalsae]
MRGFIKLVDLLNHWVFNFLAIVFGGIAVLTVYQVFARYVLNSPLVWSEEVIKYLMIWIVLLGTAIALRKGLLISVEIVLHIVPKIIQKVMQAIITILNMVFLVLLVQYGFKILETIQGQTTGALELPVSWTYAAVPIASILALINCIAVFIEIFTSKDNPEVDNDGTTIIH